MTVHLPVLTRKRLSSINSAAQCVMSDMLTVISLVQKHVTKSLGKTAVLSNLLHFSTESLSGIKILLESARSDWDPSDITDAGFTADTVEEMTTALLTGK
ncbi:hypothetical protein P879_09490 [Paragonimus westermani]|uniref:Uncharacterized protein n=1 Tax=Paragonimus westermani TaxID=34504 RepID=A0A8T0DN83_9TREM|nr:hypothetical protein P879_09490 [Paragonimus westermani]